MSELPNVLDLTGKRALVSGGHRGIGLGIARALAAAGARLAIAGRSDAGGEVARERAWLWLQTDLSRPGAAPEMVRRAVEGLGGLEILVNNAGQIDRRLALEAREEDFDRLFTVNVKAVLQAAQEAGRHMQEAGGGKIINVSSAAARLAIPGRVLYGPSKAAVSQMTRVLAVEWAPHNIQVNAIAPGWVRTDLNAAWLDEDPERFRRILEGIPAGRLGRPEDIGPLAVYLASAASAYLTGQVIEIDGGLGLG